MPGGRFFLSLFFLALSVAALSSLISLIELGVRILMDMGFTRKKAIVSIGVVAFLLGAPSAMSVRFMDNQDWVWGVGLLVSGAFFAYAAISHGVDRFRREQLNAEGADVHVGRWFNFVIPVLIPAAFVGMLGWWFWAVWPADPADGPAPSFGDKLAEWLAPFGTFSVGTCLLQWSVVIVIFVLLSRKLAALSLREDTT